MEVVCFLVTADGVHIGVKTLSGLIIIAAESPSFPLCKGMYYFHDLTGLAHVKGNGALGAVEVIVKTGVLSDKKGSRHTGKIKGLCKLTLEKILDLLYGHLCLAKG